MSWMDNIDEHLKINLHASVGHMFELSALKTQRSIYKRQHNGVGKIEDVEAILSKKEHGWLYVDEDGERQYVWPDAWGSINYSPFGISVFVASLDSPEFADSLMEELKGVIEKPESAAGQLFAMTQSRQGIELTRVGDCKSDPLNRINYSKDVIEAYDHVSTCLNSKDPCGRIVILDGPPGTGKSYMIRALTTDTAAMYVLVSPSMIGQLSGPNLLPALLQARELDDNGDIMPIVLILEDADEVLVKREAGGSRIGLSELLNLGDGLLGELADIRIVATTNAKIDEMDPAIVRPGRLCRRIHAHTLSYEEATKMYQELLGDDTLKYSTNWGTSLADVYRYAREDGWEPEVKKQVDGGNYL